MIVLKMIRFKICIIIIIVLYCLISETLEMTYYKNSIIKQIPKSIEDYINTDIVSNFESKSVFLDGNIIDLDEWLSDSTNSNDENKIMKKSKLLYTIIKCECATSVFKILESIYFMKFCDDNVQSNNNNLPLKNEDCTDEKHIIELLNKLNEKLTIIISTLFELSDYVPNVKSSEPYFIKTLLSLKLYINNLNKYHNTIKSKRIKLKNELSKIMIIQRVILQIMNQIEWFTISNCNNYVILSEEKIKIDLNEQLRNLDIMLSHIYQIDTNSLHTLINMDNLLLRNCIRDDNIENKSSQFSNICNSYFKDISIKDFLNKVEYTYDINLVYQYLQAIFEIIMKIIYQKTKDLFNAKKTLETDEYQNILLKLQLMNGPIYLIDHFKLLLSINEYRLKSDKNEIPFKEIVEKQLIEPKLFTYNLNIKLPVPNEETTDLSLAEFMQTILGNEFKQYWWVFNLLQNESNKQSHFTYNTSIYFFPDNLIYFIDEKDIKESICNALTNIYCNLFYLKNVMNDCSLTSDKNKILECFSQLRNHSVQFSVYLLRIIRKWDETEYLSQNSELLSILITAMIYLRNEYNTSIQFDTDNIEILLVIKEEKLKRTWDTIINLLDNYQIRNCRTIRSRNEIKEKECKDIKDIVSINIKWQNDSNNSIINNTVIKDHAISSNLISNKFEFIPTPYVDDDVSEQEKEELSASLNYNTFIIHVKYNDNNEFLATFIKKEFPNNFYDILQLTEGIHKLLSFTTNIYFNWYGEIKCIEEIQHDIINNMMHIYNLVDYQMLYLKWSISIFYISWIVIMEEVYDISKEYDLKTKESEINMLVNEIGKFINYNDLNNIDNYYLEKAALLHFELFGIVNLDHLYGDDIIDITKKIFINPIYELYGIVKIENIIIADVISLFGGTTKELNLSTILTNLKNFMWSQFYQIKSKFIFIDS